MSKKATIGSRAVTRALARSNRAAEEARLSSEVKGLARDAVKAAVAAACAAERAGADEGKRPDEATSVKKLARDVRTVSEEAVEHARDAIRAEDEHDAVGAALYANLAAHAAQDAESIAAVVAILVGKSREMASELRMPAPTLSAKGGREESPRERMEKLLSSSIEQSVNYLVTYNSKVIATFIREEDAFLFESELADLDREHKVESGRCEILDCRTGKRLGGYLIAGGKIFVFVQDDDYEARFRRRRR